MGVQIPSAIPAPQSCSKVLIAPNVLPGVVRCYGFVMLFSHFCCLKAILGFFAYWKIRKRLENICLAQQISVQIGLSGFHFFPCLPGFSCLCVVSHVGHWVFPQPHIVSVGI